jgi:hypothetical protein
MQVDEYGVEEEVTVLRPGALCLWQRRVLHCIFSTFFALRHSTH